MTVTINGTTGVAVPLGSVSAPGVSNTTSSTTGIYNPTSTSLAIATNGTNAVHVDASQNVGIGTTSPASGVKFAVVGGGIQLSGGTSAQAGLRVQYASSVATISGINNDNNTYNPISFFTSGTEAMRIDSSGNLLVGQTTSSFGGKICTTFTSASQVAATFTDTVTSGYTGSYVVFLNSSSAVAGYISHPSATTVGYVASSDYRLKKDVAPLSGSLDRVMKLKPVSYTWTEDDVYGEGFIAHELQEVIPLAAYGIKDAVNEDGSIKPQGVDYGKLTTVLVAAMQEQQKLIQELSAEVTALKAKVGA